MFSYGSGLASSMFSIIIRSSSIITISEISKKANIKDRIQSRICLSPSEFIKV